MTDKALSEFRPRETPLREDATQAQCLALATDSRIDRALCLLTDSSADPLCWAHSSRFLCNTWGQHTGGAEPIGLRPGRARLAVRRNADRVWACERREAEEDANRDGRDDRQDSAHGMPPGNRCFFTRLCRLAGRDSSLRVHRCTVLYTALSVFTPSRLTTVVRRSSFTRLLSLARARAAPSLQDQRQLLAETDPGMRYGRSPPRRACPPNQQRPSHLDGPYGATGSQSFPH